MKPFALLILIFSACSIVPKLASADWNLPFAANLAMFLMLCLTASGHFLFKKGMALMIPPLIPYKTQLVYLTGLLEIILGIALLFQASRSYAGYMLILFFILILPANIYAAIKRINIEKGTYDGPGLNYLWFRIPLQLFFIAWLWYFSVMQISAQCCHQ